MTHLRCLAALLLVAAATTAAAQGYPTRPVKLIVPFPPGGAVDFYARAVQNRLAEALGQPILIENRAGAGGMIGADLVAKAPADGYTVLVGNIAALAMNVGVYAKMPYDPVKDLTPIMRTVAVNYALVVHPRLHASVARVMELPEVRERLVGGGLDPIVSTPQEFGAFIRAEIVKWSKVAKDVGARVD